MLVVVFVAGALLLAVVAADKPKKGRVPIKEVCNPEDEAATEKKCPEGDCDDPCKNFTVLNLKKKCYGRLRECNDNN